MSQHSGGNQQEKKEPMIQRPLRKYKQDLVKNDAELARKLQQEEEERSKQFHNDEMLAQQISNDLNRNGFTNGATPDEACGLQQDFTRYRGMTEVDALLARQIQEQEEKSVVLSSRCQSPGQQDAGICRRVVGRAPDNRITIRARGRRRPYIPVLNQAQLPDGEDDPDTLLMTIGGGLETNFINIMRDPHLVIMALSRTPQFTGNQANVDLNDYEGLLDLAERLGEVQNKGMTPGDIGNLPTHSHQGGATAAGQNTDCQVCLTGFEQGETIRTLPCLHEYHQSCVDEWLQRNSTCPICRQNVKESM